MAGEINIIFNPADGRYSSIQLLEAVKACIARVEKHLGLVAGHVEIEVYRNRDYWVDSHTRINENELFTWVGGDSGRIIRVVADEKKVVTDSALAHMVCHECVHHIVRSHTSPLIPAWLDEGLAVLMVQKLPKSYLSALADALEQDALLPFSLLEPPFSRFDRSLKSLAYAESTSLVQYFVETFGYPFVRELLECCRRGDRIESILRGKGLTEYLLEKEWLCWLPGFLAACTSCQERQV